MRINGEHHPGMETPSNQPDLMHTPIEKERNLPAIAGHCRVQTNQSCCTHRPRASLRFCLMSLGLAGLTGRASLAEQDTLWLFNIAMEAMAHWNRWFTY